MALQEQQLGQAQPSSDGGTDTLFQVGQGETFVMKGLFITNITNSDVVVSVYSDPTGTTYNDTTVIIKDLKIPSGQFMDISTFIAISQSSGTIGVECDTANGANFIGFGGVIT